MTWASRIVYCLQTRRECLSATVSLLYKPYVFLHGRCSMIIIKVRKKAKVLYKHLCGNCCDVGKCWSSGCDMWDPIVQATPLPLWIWEHSILLAYKTSPMHLRFDIWKLEPQTLCLLQFMVVERMQGIWYLENGSKFVPTSLLMRITTDLWLLMQCLSNIIIRVKEKIEIQQSSWFYKPWNKVDFLHIKVIGLHYLVAWIPSYLCNTSWPISIFTNIQSEFSEVKGKQNVQRFIIIGIWEGWMGYQQN